MSAVLIVATVGISLFSVAAPVSITVPFSSTSVLDADLDGDPSTGAWEDALSVVIPLENGEPDPIGSATLFVKHDGGYLYFRIDGFMDILWVSTAGDHFWLGFQVSPTGTSHHGSGEWDGTFFGHSSFATQPVAVDTNGFRRPPAEDASQDVIGFMGSSGVAYPYPFTAEWKRPLSSGDADDLIYVADGTTTYNFFATTDSNGGGSSGGNINHLEMTNLNTMRIAPGEVPNEPPTAAFDWSPLTPQEGASVSFTDLSTDPDGPEDIVSWSWEFGDGGTSVAQHPTHTYADDDVYTVNLTVTDSAGNSDKASASITVLDVDPVADFTWSPPTPLEGEVVTFSDQSVSYDSIVSWAWDLDGDGLVDSTAVSPTWTYAAAGDYAVTLTVSEADGDVDSQSHTVEVTSLAPPVASFTFQPAEPIVGETVTFDASGSYDPDGRIVSYSWDFGDGTTGSGVTAAHSYEAAGTYSVTLTVTDNDGLSGLVSEDVIVSPPPPGELLGKLKRTWPDWRRAYEGTPQVLYAKVVNLGTLDIYAQVVYEISDRETGEIVATLTSPVVLLRPRQVLGGPEFATDQWVGPIGIYRVTATLYYGPTESDVSIVDGVKAISRFAIVPPKDHTSSPQMLSGESWHPDPHAIVAERPKPTKVFVDVTPTAMAAERSTAAADKAELGEEGL
ncbi:MAG: PKD domain-containing protein [Anaerolineae bacterium]|nr:PKD domain-containing protein [Anaerolineae bacterium]